jgi:signal transduction histidine kinase
MPRGKDVQALQVGTAGAEAVPSGISTAFALEKTNQQWEHAADALPQLICLLDERGKVIGANRTIERWGLMCVTQVRGLTLHEALHGPHCADNCEMHGFWRGVQRPLLRGQEVRQERWDAKLERHLSIVIRPRPPAKNDEVRAIAAIDDVGELHAELQRLTAQHVNVREDERRRLARDLHDDLGQSLNALKLSIQQSAQRFEAEQPGRPAQSLHQLARDVQRIMGDVRRIAMDLRPSTLDDLGLIPTLRWFFRELEASCKAPRVERAIEVTDADVPEPLKIAIYRILQEAICNTVRHAGATAVRVRLHRDADGLHLCIQDNGRGFNGDAARGIGLRSMKERAESAGGRLLVESQRGKGTRLTASWSLHSARSRSDAQPRGA